MLGSKRIRIYMQCPGCLTDNGYAEQEYWRHGGTCGGILQLDEYANVICSRCREYTHLTKMRLSCDSGRHVLFTPGIDATTASLLCSAAFVNNMGLTWLRSVVKYLAD